MRPRWLPLIVLAAVVVSMALYLLPKRKGMEAGRVVSVTEALGGEAGKGFARAVGPRRFSFPADHGPHPGFRTEWWYFTGNLKAANGRTFGYQLTFFRVALKPKPVARNSRWGTNEVFMAHFAVTDVEGKRFYYSERFGRAALGLAGAGGSPLVVRLEDWSAVETLADPWAMELAASNGDVGVDLNVRSLTPVVLNGEGGLSRKGMKPGNASYYYSIPRMETSGTVRVGKETFPVSGLSWLDREWGTSALERSQVGWDWFALQLDDGRDLMFYRLRRGDGTTDPFSSGTLVAADGTSRHLAGEEVKLEITGWWTSPASGARYPSPWRLRVPREKLDLEIVPRFADQELLTSVRYWEGAVTVEGMSAGSPGGSGYLEMTGPSTPTVETQVSLPLAGTVDASRLSLPVLTLVMAVLDSFNPCAFFVLFFLLSLLVHAHSRQRMIVIGGIFVLFSGFLYFLFMAAWLNFFLLFGRLRAITAIAGIVALIIAALNIKDFFFFKKGISLVIPEQAKPRLFERMREIMHAGSFPAMLAATVFLAFAANTYELICTAGFPMVYTRALTLQRLPVPGYYAYLALYNVVYVIPLACIVAFFTATLGSRKLSEWQGRALKLLSGSMMLCLGIVLLTRPTLLTNALVSVSLLLLSVTVAGGVVIAARCCRMDADHVSKTDEREKRS